MRKLIIMVLVLSCCWVASAQDLGTYVDEEGKLHITNNPRQGWRKLNSDGSSETSATGDVFTVRTVTGSVPYSALINQAAREYGLDGYLIKAVIQVESSFQPRAVSTAGAKGLMQLMDGTANWLGVTDSFDPRQNIHAGTRYLRNLLNVYDGNLRLALAAYNAGQGAVSKYGGVPPYKETVRYLKKIAAIYSTLDYRISEAEMASSLVVARALSHGRTVVYRYETANGHALSEMPPHDRAYIEIALNKY